MAPFGVFGESQCRFGVTGAHRTYAAGMSDDAFIEVLLQSITSSPTPYHCAATAAKRLSDGGFQEVDRTASLPSQAGRYYRIEAARSWRGSSRTRTPIDSR